MQRYHRLKQEVGELMADVEKVGEAQQSSEKLLEVTPANLIEDVRVWLIICLLPSLKETTKQNVFPLHSLHQHFHNQWELIIFSLLLFTILCLFLPSPPSSHPSLLPPPLPPFSLLPSLPSPSSIQVQLLQKQLHGMQLDRTLGTQLLVAPEHPHQTLLLRWTKCQWNNSSDNYPVASMSTYYNICPRAGIHNFHKWKKHPLVQSEHTHTHTHTHTHMWSTFPQLEIPSSLCLSKQTLTLFTNLCLFHHFICCKWSKVEGGGDLRIWTSLK